MAYPEEFRGFFRGQINISNLKMFAFILTNTPKRVLEPTCNLKTNNLYFQHWVSKVTSKGTRGWFDGTQSRVITMFQDDIKASPREKGKKSQGEVFVLMLQKPEAWSKLCQDRPAQ